jgi:hypothetical protein
MHASNGDEPVGRHFDGQRFSEVAECQILFVFRSFPVCRMAVRTKFLRPLPNTFCTL